MSLSLVRKLGLEKICDEVYDNPLVRSGLVVEVYRVTLDQLEGILASFSGSD